MLIRKHKSCNNRTGLIKVVISYSIHYYFIIFDPSTKYAKQMDTNLKNYNKENNTRKCKRCRQWLNLSMFATRIVKTKKNIQYREVCKNCSLDKIHDPKYSDPAYRRNVYRRNICYKLILAAGARAKRNNIEFSITKQDISMPENCPYLNIPIKINDIKSNYNSPSIDRIDNSKGYIKGNVIIVSRKANTIKNNATLQELELLVKNYKRVLYKSGELREQPEVVNPDLSKSLDKGDFKEQRIVGEPNNNPTTSARHSL